MIGRLAGRLPYAAFLDGISLRIRPSEPSALEVALVIEAGRRSDGRKRLVVVARKALATAGGTRLVRLQPRRRLLGRRLPFIVRVRVRATDSEGNQRVVAKRLRVVEAG